MVSKLSIPNKPSIFILSKNDYYAGDDTLEVEELTCMYKSSIQQNATHISLFQVENRPQYFLTDNDYYDEGTNAAFEGDS